MAFQGVGCLPLSNVKDGLNGLVNLIGVVTDFLEPVPSRGPDLVSTFTIKDESWENLGLGLRVRFFRPQISELPTVTAIGDVVILLSVKIMDQRGEVLATSNRSTQWIVFPKANIDRFLSRPNSTLEYEQASPTMPARTQKELACVVRQYRQIELKEYEAVDEQQADLSILASATRHQPSRNDTTSGNPRGILHGTSRALTDNFRAKTDHQMQQREKFSLIENLNLSDTGPRVFVDLCCEVRKKYDEYERVNLSVTDYTSNKLLFNYVSGHEEEEDTEYRDGDPFGHTSKKCNKWQGPWGRMTMNVTCFDVNAQFVKTNINVGDYIYLSNVYIVNGRNGVLMEGKLRDDPRYPDKILTQKLSRDDRAEHLRDLIKRKLDYKKRHKQLYESINVDYDTAEKRSLPEDIDGKPETVKKSKAQQRKEKKREQLLKQQREATLKEPRTKLNENITCNQISNITSISLSEILDNPALSFDTGGGTTITLPFHNVCYRTKVRVIDFFPPSIADFAAPYQESDRDFLLQSTNPSSLLGSSQALSYDSEDSDNDLLLPSDLDSQDSDTERSAGIRWEWRFCLLVEDPHSPSTPQMLLHVDNHGGAFLLNEDACNLRRNPQVLNRLREKLFHLWGELEDDKRAAATAAAEVSPADGAATTTAAAAAAAAAVAKSTGGKPFECYIKEYGIPKQRGTGRNTVDYARMFQLWGVRVNA